MDNNQLKSALINHAVAKGSELHGSTIGINQYGVIGEIIPTPNMEDYYFLVRTHDWKALYPSVISRLHINHNGTFSGPTNI
jgi:hypothetical protein